MEIISNSSPSSMAQRASASNSPQTPDTERTAHTPSLGAFTNAGIGEFEGAIVGRRRVTRNASAYREQDSFEALFYVRYGQFKLTEETQPVSRMLPGFA